MKYNNQIFEIAWIKVIFGVSKPSIIFSALELTHRETANPRTAS